MTPEQEKALRDRGGGLLVITFKEWRKKSYLTEYYRDTNLGEDIQKLLECPFHEVVIFLYRNTNHSMEYICGYLTGYFTHSESLDSKRDYYRGLTVAKTELGFM